MGNWPRTWLRIRSPFSLSLSLSLSLSYIALYCIARPGSSPNSLDDFCWLIREEKCQDFVCFTTPHDVTTTGLAHMSEICRKHGTRFHWFPIRKYDPLDLRRNLPKCVAALTRLLKTNRIINGTMVVVVVRWKH